MTDTPSYLVPGLVPTGPPMVTSRFDQADGYTYDGYVRTGGYSALRRAVTSMTPEQTAEFARKEQDTWRPILEKLAQGDGK